MVAEPRKRENDLPGEMALYIHIPFCQSRCPYCDFNTYAGLEALVPSYVKSVAREIHLWGALLGETRVNTTFFGGGTPSCIPPQAIASILEAARFAFKITPNAEVTLEANPGDLAGEHVRSLLGLGINRLSIGVQSLKDPLLETLGRRHSASEALAAFVTARQAGFDNISMDLMYGIPHQSMEDWQDTLERVLALMPDHLSLYCLTLEEDTPMEQRIRQGTLPRPDPDLAADMYLLAEELLSQAGYRHYEISNWATPGRESRHNLTYWRNLPYLGVGLGAHSYLGGYRFHNVGSPHDYIHHVGGTSPLPSGTRGVSSETLALLPTVASVEAIDERLEMAETMMLGLRLEEGVGLREFACRFGKTLPSVYGATIDELTALGLLEQRAGSLRLTGRGRLLGNEVFLRFFTK